MEARFQGKEAKFLDMGVEMWDKEVRIANHHKEAIMLAKLLDMANRHMMEVIHNHYTHFVHNLAINIDCLGEHTLAQWSYHKMESM